MVVESHVVRSVEIYNIVTRLIITIIIILITTIIIIMKVIKIVM